MTFTYDDMFAGLKFYQEKGFYDSGGGTIESEKYGRPFGYSFKLNEYVKCDYYRLPLKPKVTEYVNNLLLKMPEDVRNKYEFSIVADFDWSWGKDRDNYEGWEIKDILKCDETIYVDVYVEDDLSETEQLELMTTIRQTLYSTPDIPYKSIDVREYNGEYFFSVL
jgi:hypothetical protein